MLSNSVYVLLVVATTTTYRLSVATPHTPQSIPYAPLFVKSCKAHQLRGLIYKKAVIVEPTIAAFKEHWKG